MPRWSLGMATATKARKAKNEEPAMTLDEAVENLLRENLELYREYVARGARGEQLYGDELARIEATLTELGLPHYAWERDLQATKKHGVLTAELAKLDEAQPAAEAEAKQLAAEIPQIERRLNEARGRLNELQKVRPATQIGLAQRLQELRVNHPHLFHSIAKAVELKMEARRKVAAQQRQAEMPKEGWLP